MEERECDCTLIIQESSNKKTINLKCMPILSSKIIPETWFFKAWSLKKLLLSSFKKVLLSLLLLVLCILHLISLLVSTSELLDDLIKPTKWRCSRPYDHMWNVWRFHEDWRLGLELRSVCCGVSLRSNQWCMQSQSMISSTSIFWINKSFEKSLKSKLALVMQHNQERLFPSKLLQHINFCHMIC